MTGRAPSTVMRPAHAGPVLALAALLTTVLLLDVLTAPSASAQSVADALQRIADADPPGSPGADLLGDALGHDASGDVPSSHYELGAAA